MVPAESLSSPRRFVIHDLDDPEARGVETADRPDPGPDQALVEVEAVGLTYFESLISRGRYQVRPAVPFTPGSSGTGRVVAIGPTTTWCRVGDRVALHMALGGLLASHVVVGEHQTSPLAEGIDGATWAAWSEALTTLHFGFTRRHPVRPGQRVLVLGAGGALGAAATAIAASAGAHVIAVASDQEKRRHAREMGAEVTLPPTDLADQVRDRAPEGVDLVIDPVGGELALTALKLLAREGRHAVLGFASGDIPRLGANRILMGNHTVVGVDFGDATRSDPTLAQQVLREVASAVARGTYRLTPPTTYSLEDVGDALDAIGAGTVHGRAAAVFGAAG